MGLLGNGYDDPRSAANMALAAGLLRGDFAGGLLGSDQAYRGVQADALKMQLGKAQMEDMAQQAELRRQQAAQMQRRADMQSAFLFGGAPGGASAGGMPQAAGSGAMGGPAAPAAGVPTGQGAGYMGSPGGLIGMARQMGIPEQAIQADVAFNEGKGIAKMLYERGVPNMQVHNGYAVNMNQLQPGYLPSLNISQDGKASMVQIGPDGLPVVSAPRGSMETYSGYRQADEAAKAGQDLVRVVARDGSERYVTRSQAVQATQPRPMVPQAPQAPQGQPQGAYVGDPQVVMAAINDIKDPMERARAKQAWEQQYGPLQATPTTAQAADRARSIKQAETDVRPIEQRQNEIASSNYMLSVLDQAIKHPGRETATGLSATLDPRNYVPGTNAKGFQSLLDQVRGGTFMQAYQNLKGGGQITEVEGQKAENAIARLNTAQSDEDVLSALKELRAVVYNGLTRQKMGLRASNGATGSFEGDNSEMVRPDQSTRPANLPQPMRGMVRNGYRFKGGDPASPNSWEKM